MRCACAHLGWRGPTVAIGGHVPEGQNGNVSRWSRIANKAKGKAISIKYQLLEHVWRLQIHLPERLQAGVMFGGGWEIA